MALPKVFGVMAGDAAKEKKSPLALRWGDINESRGNCETTWRLGICTKDGFKKAAVAVTELGYKGDVANTLLTTGYGLENGD